MSDPKVLAAQQIRYGLDAIGEGMKFLAAALVVATVIAAFVGGWSVELICKSWDSVKVEAIDTAEGG